MHDIEISPVIQRCPRGPARFILVTAQNGIPMKVTLENTENPHFACKYWH